MALVNPGSVCVIETTGRRTGRRRFTPVGYWQSADGSFMVGGGAAGKSTTPDWVANLRTRHDAAVWVHRRRIPVAAHELAGQDRTAAQEHAARIWHGVGTYERRSGRVIPYFRLVPLD